MSQVFSADAQVLANTVANVGVGPQNLFSTNPLQPPFETAKAKVLAVLQFIVPTGCTRIEISLIRNADSENLTIAGNAFDVTAGAMVLGIIGGVDPIPDGRAVTYTVQIAWDNATANDGSCVDGSYIESMLLSG